MSIIFKREISSSPGTQTYTQKQSMHRPCSTLGYLSIIVNLPGQRFHGVKVYLDFMVLKGVLSATLHYCYLNAVIIMVFEAFLSMKSAK